MLKLFFKIPSFKTTSETKIQLQDRDQDQTLEMASQDQNSSLGNSMLGFGFSSHRWTATGAYFNGRRTLI